MTREMRRQFTADQEATILRRDLVDKIPVSDLCGGYRNQHSLFYVWQRHAFGHLGRRPRTAGPAGRMPGNGRTGRG